MFVKYNAVLRGIQTTVPFLRNTMISLCCSKEVADSGVPNAHTTSTVFQDGCLILFTMTTTTLPSISSQR